VKRIVLVALLLLARQSGAQELDIFDINDFVDPRALGANLDEKGQLACPCRRFLASRLLVGRVEHYADNSNPTRANVIFERIATSYYAGLWQFNLKVSRIREPKEIQDGPFFLGTLVPRGKYGLQLGRYWAVGGSEDREPTILRAEVTWTVSQYHGFAVRRPHHPVSRYQSYYGEELGAELDTSIPLWGHRLNGSLVYVGRFDGGQSFDSVTHYRTIDDAFRYHRASYVYRFPRLSVGGVNVDATTGVGIEARQGTRLSTTFVPSLEVTSPPIPRLGIRVHLRYQPSIDQIPGVRDTIATHQVTLFIDRALLTIASR
jgi:hypothetical protein